MEILPINYTPDLEKNNHVGIEEMSITYIQPADTCSNSDEIQTLTISTQYGSSISFDDTDGFYFNISIPEGKHWSIDNEEELVEIVKDFKKRLYNHD